MTRAGARRRVLLSRLSPLRVSFAPLALAALSACAHRPRPGGDPHARPRCATLDPAACTRAHALTAAASTYADEAHDYVLVSSRVAPQAALARTDEGWRPLPLACARAHPSPPQLDPRVTEYAFVGVVVDATLVSSDADVGPLLSRAPASRAHEVKLVALAFVRDLAPPTFAAGSALVERPSGGCTCGDATHFAGATKYGAMLAYAFPLAPLRRDAHVRALDVVRAALADPRVDVRESRGGAMTIDGLASAPSSSPGPATPLAFRVTAAVPLAFAASPVGELCDFPAPDVSPSPLDFGLAPYGTEARRSVHVVNRAAVELQALLGASTFLLPARGAIDLPLRWTPDGDAPGCETQTRDEAIPFLRLGGGTPRVARVLETIRTGRATLEHSEHVAAAPADLAAATRDWSCPRDFARTSCRAENGSGADVVAEPRGENGCHFACRTPGAAATPPRAPPCRFDATMTCALRCAN